MSPSSPTGLRASDLDDGRQGPIIEKANIVAGLLPGVLLSCCRSLSLSREDKPSVHTGECRLDVAMRIRVDNAWSGFCQLQVRGDDTSTKQDLLWTLAYVPAPNRIKPGYPTPMVQE